ncbi:MAG: cytochrome D1 domain-containing protein [Brachymonas sp.]
MRPFLKPSLFSRPVRRLSVVSQQGSVLRAGMGSLAICTLTGLAAAGAAGASAAGQSAAAAMPSASGAAVAQRDAGPLEWMMRAHQPASAAAVQGATAAAHAATTAPSRHRPASAPAPESGTGAAAGAEPPGVPAREAAALYAQHCASCHGATRMGAMGPALLPESLERLRHGTIVQTIRDGRPATQMQAYGRTLTEAQIRGIARWLQQAPEQAPSWTEADMRASHHTFVQPDYGPVAPVFRADPRNLFVVVEAGDHHVSILDGDTFTPLTRFASHYALHGGPKFSPDGRFVYFGSRDGWVSQYDLYRLQKVAEIRVGINTRNVAVSDDGKWVMAGNTLPNTLVLLDAHGLAPVRTYPVVDRQGHPSRVSAVYDAAPRKSFVVALKDAPELWEISCDPHAEPLYKGLVHDYRLKEAMPTPAYLEPRVIPLDVVLDDFYFDPDYRYVMGASRAGKGEVISLLSGAKVADLPLRGMPHLGSGITFRHDGHLYMASTNLQTSSVTVIDMGTWKVVKDIPLPGPGFFLRSHEDTPYMWADSMMSPTARDTLSIIDKRTLQVVRELRLRPGKTNAHVEFTRDGRYALVSIMENPGELVVVDARTLREVKSLPMSKPIGKYNVFNKVTRSEGTSH